MEGTVQHALGFGKLYDVERERLAERVREAGPIN